MTDQPAQAIVDLPTAGGEPVIVSDPTNFADWAELLALILRSFDYMKGRIDPPSSALALTPDELNRRAETETLLLAYLDGSLAGCAFLAQRADHFYLGKLAVEPKFQGKGTGKALLAAAERHAREAGSHIIELQTRVEVVDNHRTFVRLGFRETARTAHQGYDRPTSLTMRKVLD